MSTHSQIVNEVVEAVVNDRRIRPLLDKYPNETYQSLLMTSAANSCLRLFLKRSDNQIAILTDELNRANFTIYQFEGGHVCGKKSCTGLHEHYLPLQCQSHASVYQAEIDTLRLELEHTLAKSVTMEKELSLTSSRLQSVQSIAISKDMEIFDFHGKLAGLSHRYHKALNINSAVITTLQKNRNCNGQSHLPVLAKGNGTSNAQSPFNLEMILEDMAVQRTELVMENSVMRAEIKALKNMLDVEMGKKQSGDFDGFCIISNSGKSPEVASALRDMDFPPRNDGSKHVTFDLPADSIIMTS